MVTFGALLIWVKQSQAFDFFLVQKTCEPFHCAVHHVKETSVALPFYSLMQVSEGHSLISTLLLHLPLNFVATG